MDELQTKLFWHLLPQCSNSVLLRVQDACGLLPHPEKLSAAQQNWMPDPLLQSLTAHLKKPSDEFLRRLDYARQFVEDYSVRLIERGTSDYPALLAEIPDPPALFYVRGAYKELNNPQIAVVGSRRCSRTGQADAKAFSRCMTQSGFAITSGLALGIDTAAHLGALDAQGITTAVIGSGLDNIYPRQNCLLAEQILDSGGSLVSEFSPGTPPLPQHFPRRNRIISGLAVASLIVEASERSGSLITARMAMEQGREVLVLPGSIHDPLKRGCHRLIRDGASLVCSAEQVVDQLGSLLGYQLALLDESKIQPSQKQNIEVGAEEEVEQRLARALKHIEFETIAMDDLLELTQLQAVELLEILTDLELQGMVQRGPEGVKRLR